MIATDAKRNTLNTPGTVNEADDATAPALSPIASGGMRGDAQNTPAPPPPQATPQPAAAPQQQPAAATPMAAPRQQPALPQPYVAPQQQAPQQQQTPQPFRPMGTGFTQWTPALQNAAAGGQNTRLMQPFDARLQNAQGAGALVNVTDAEREILARAEADPLSLTAADKAALAAATARLGGGIEQYDERAMDALALSGLLGNDSSGWMGVLQEQAPGRTAGMDLLDRGVFQVDRQGRDQFGNLQTGTEDLLNSMSAGGDLRALREEADSVLGAPEQILSAAQQQLTARSDAERTRIESLRGVESAIRSRDPSKIPPPGSGDGSNPILDSPIYGYNYNLLTQNLETLKSHPDQGFAQNRALFLLDDFANKTLRGQSYSEPGEGLLIGDDQSQYLAALQRLAGGDREAIATQDPNALRSEVGRFNMAGPGFEQRGREAQQAAAGRARYGGDPNAPKAEPFAAYTGRNNVPGIEQREGWVNELSKRSFGKEKQLFNLMYWDSVTQGFPPTEAELAQMKDKARSYSREDRPLPVNPAAGPIDWRTL